MRFVPEILGTVRALYLRRGRPIVVYQMGKVGSRAIYHSLSRFTERPLLHVHNLRPGTPRLSYRLMRRAVVEQRRPADFVTLVREPVRRNISAFLENASRDLVEQRHDLTTLTRHFMADFRHDRVLVWLDQELGYVLGTDAYAHAFPTGEGALVLPSDLHRVIILRSEQSDAAKAEHVRRFLGLGRLEIERGNMTAAKHRAHLYRELVTRAPLSESYIDSMLSSRYARHFYSAAELGALAEYWNTKPRPFLSPLEPDAGSLSDGV